MKKLSIIMPIVAFAAISTFAADGGCFDDVFLQSRNIQEKPAVDGYL